MRVPTAITLGLIICLACVGCGSGKLRTKGHVVKDGTTFIPESGTYLEVTLLPVVGPGEKAKNWYYCEVDEETGVFRAAGPDKRGVPPGKYKVVIELKKNKKDLFKGKYDTVNSPYVVDLDGNTDEIVIDLDHPPGKK